MKILKWLTLCFAGVLLIWCMLLVFYFKSMALPHDSLFYPSSKVTASPYATFSVLGYSQDQREAVALAMETFAHSHNMVMKGGSRFQTEVLHLAFQSKSIRTKVLNVKVGDNFLFVALYKEELWANLSEKEHRAFFNELIEVYQDLNLQVIDIEFDPKFKS